MTRVTHAALAAAACRVVQRPSYGFAAVLFDSGLDGGTFDTCRRA
ncbi:MAG TPA: hypothetical protein VGD91_03310 [Trebonia sp.]